MKDGIAVRIKLPDGLRQSDIRLEHAFPQARINQCFASQARLRSLHRVFMIRLRPHRDSKTKLMSIT